MRGRCAGILASFPGAIRRIDVVLYVGDSTQERRMRLTAYDGDVQVIDRFEAVFLAGATDGGLFRYRGFW